MIRDVGPRNVKNTAPTGHRPATNLHRVDQDHSDAASVCAALPTFPSNEHGSFGERDLMNLSSIVYASDNSYTSRSALEFASALAEWEDADLHVIFLTQTRGESRIRAPLVKGKRRTTVIVPDGDPVKTIVEYSARVRADLIVVGASLGAMGTDDLGRLAEGGARQAECATLLVPLEAPYRRDELPFRNLLCPVDFSPGSVLAYEHALKLTQRAGGTLTLLHVVDEFQDREGDVRLLPPIERQLRSASARGRLRLAVSEESLNWCHVGVHVTSGAADVHIVAEARRLGADLVVMSVTSRANALAVPLGSMVGRIVAQVTCPVLVIRDRRGSPGWDDVYAAQERRVPLNPEKLPRLRVAGNHIGT